MTDWQENLLHSQQQLQVRSSIGPIVQWLILIPLSATSQTTLHLAHLLGGALQHRTAIYIYSLHRIRVWSQSVDISVVEISVASKKRDLSSCCRITVRGV